MEDFLSIIEVSHESKDVPSGVFNVSTGESRSILDVFEAVSSYLGIVPEEASASGSARLRMTFLKSYLIPSQTEKVLGWKAQVGFEETILSNACMV